MIIPVFETLANTSAVINLAPSSCHDLDKCRTIWNIIWSCVVTLFACIWLAIHPNIPAPEDSWGRRAARRLWMMLLALLAPELIVGWATRQLIAACRIARDNKEYGWTKTHGFFAVMGGYMECDENGVPIRTITIDNLKSLLSKSFALLQTGWFILQCIARAIEGLPVTELEVATGAFAVLNLATYVLWWNKPLNVSCPVRVWANEGKDKGHKVERCLRSSSLWNTFKRGLADFVKEVYRPIAARVDSVGVLNTVVLFPFLVFVPILDGSSFESNERRVGTFGPEDKTEPRDMLMTALVGIVFGGIHCVAWVFYFPTHTERLLWRVSAISVTVVPLYISLSFLIIEKMSSLYSVFLGTGLILAIALYVFARLTLLILPFMALRSLPPGAYRTADWTRFIPHI